MTDHADRPSFLDASAQRERIARTLAERQRVSEDAARPSVLLSGSSVWFAVRVFVGVIGGAWIVEQYVAPAWRVLFGGAW